MIETLSRNKITVVVSGICQECGCEVTSNNIGFECNEFVICKKCNRETEEEYDTFQAEMNDEVQKIIS